MTTQLEIEASALGKAFRGNIVLRDLDLQVKHGSVFAMLGPNGAGKTTTIRILSTLLAPDSGAARIAGFDVVRQRRQVRQVISLTGQYPTVDDLQTGEENLRMMGRLCGLSRRRARLRAADLLAQFELDTAARRRVSTYSGGMRRRLDLAASLVTTPSVIFLDEPTTGLDLRSRQAMWQVITGLAQTGTTVFLTTQYLEEADRMADWIAVLDAGRVIAEGTPERLKERVAAQRLDITAASSDAFAAITRVLGHRIIQSDPSRLTIGAASDGTARQVRDLLDELDPERRAVSRFTVHTPTLDDVFLCLTGHGASAAPHTAGRGEDVRRER